MADRTDPNTPSGDYKAMVDYWQTADDLFRGAGAVRDAGQRYLPKWHNESWEQYRDRLRWAKYTNVYGDILNNLADKPFSEEVTLVDSPAKYQTMVEDIDGQGNNLHNFAATFFKAAINSAIDWIYVDYTQVNPNTVDANGRVRRKSVAEERRAGARPYWVRVSALEMIAVYSAVLNGVELFVHCRMIEVSTERDGYDEVTVTRIREINRDPIYNEDGLIIDYAAPTWTLHVSKDKTWEVEDSGTIDIGIIPIVPLIIGERIGNSWRIDPSMRDVADLQIDLYQQECGLQNARQLTAFPMLSADGVEPEMETYTDDDGNTRTRPVPAPVGPRTVLYGGRSADGGQGGSWKYVEFQGNSLRFLSEEIKSSVKELREIGRQPLTASSGNLTVVTTAFAAQKGNSAVKAWVLALKDALELAFRYSALWMNDEDGPSVNVYTDFEEGIGQDDGFEDVVTMRKEGDLSQETLWEEAKRRGRLSDEFTVDRERDRLEKEDQDKPSPLDIMAALGGLNNPPENEEQTPPEEEEEDDNSNRVPELG